MILRRCDFWRFGRACVTVAVPTTTLSQDGDGNLDAEERKRLLAQIKGNVVVADVPAESSETMEVSLALRAFDALCNGFVEPSR